MITYSPSEVAAQFGGESDWWLREGIRKGDFPYLRVGRCIRLTDAHVEYIAAALERLPAENIADQTGPLDVSVFNPSSRSRSRHKRAS